MKAKSENRVSMFKAVDVVFTENPALWQGTAAWVNAVALFRAGLANIQAIAQVRDSDTTGVTAGKQAKREAMGAATLEVAGAVAAYASDTSDHELLAKADLYPSDLTRARDTEVTTICQSIHDMAGKVVAELADYGITAQTLTDLQAAITAYSGAVGKPAFAKSSKQAAGTSLDDAIATVDTVVEEKLDKHAQRVRRSQPTFFQTYTAARSVINNRGGRKAKNGNGNGDSNGGTPANQ